MAHAGMLFSYKTMLLRGEAEVLEWAAVQAKVESALLEAEAADAADAKKEQDKEERRQQVLAKRAERVARKRALGSARQKEPAGAGDEVLAADDYLSIEVFEGDDEGAFSSPDTRAPSASVLLTGYT